VDERAIGKRAASGVDGKLLIVGASFEPFTVSSLQLLMARKSVMGYGLSGAVWPTLSLWSEQPLLRVRRVLISGHMESPSRAAVPESPPSRTHIALSRRFWKHCLLSAEAMVRRIACADELSL